MTGDSHSQADPTPGRCSSGVIPQHQRKAAAAVRTPRDVAVAFLMGVCGFDVPDVLIADRAEAEVDPDLSE